MCRLIYTGYVHFEISRANLILIFKGGIMSKCTQLLSCAFIVINLLSGCAKAQSKTQVYQSTHEQYFLTKIPLVNGQSIVVAEGQLEPRSIGSVSVSLYRDLYVGDFITSKTLIRDGTVNSVELITLNDEQYQLIITTITAGSGQYQNKQIICINQEVLSQC